MSTIQRLKVLIRTDNSQKSYWKLHSLSKSAVRGDFMSRARNILTPFCNHKYNNNFNKLIRLVNKIERKHCRCRFDGNCEAP